MCKFDILKNGAFCCRNWVNEEWSDHMKCLLDRFGYSAADLDAPFLHDCTPNRPFVRFTQVLLWCISDQVPLSFRCFLNLVSVWISFNGCQNVRELFFSFLYFWLFSRRRLETSTLFCNLGYKKIEDKFFISSLVLWVQWDYVCKNFFRMEKAFVKIKWLCYVEEHLSNASVKSVSIAFLIFRTLLEEALFSSSEHFSEEVLV